MNRSATIQPIIAAFLALVFCVASTPKEVVHALLANHQDYAAGCAHRQHNDACLSKAGVNCHFHQLVVEQPYRPVSAVTVVAGKPFNACTTFQDAPHHYCSTQQVAEGRGPPQS